MGQIIDARAYFDLSSWLPEIQGARRIDVIKEWLEIEEDAYCQSCHLNHKYSDCPKAPPLNLF